MLVLDNIDYVIKSSVDRLGKTNRTENHHINSYAITARIVDPALSKQKKDAVIDPTLAFHTESDTIKIRNALCHLVFGFLKDHLPGFSQLSLPIRNVLYKDLRAQVTDEMPLPMHFKDEKKYSEILDVLQSFIVFSSPLFRLFLFFF
jgi:hypothetical protein